MKTAARTKSRIKSRLAASDWVDAAALIMSRRGIADVRIEVLAKELKVTKGSFYWHFKDRNALFDALLLSYEARSHEFMESVLASAASPSMQLRSMLASPQRMANREITETIRMELAIRSWARRSVHVRNLVRRSDEVRWEKTHAILQANGVKPNRARVLNNVLQALLFHLWTRDELSADEKEELIEFFAGVVGEP
jgi:AcrR family transcriptional regulator